MKRLAGAGRQGGAGKTSSAIRRVPTVKCFEKCPGADERGIAQMECFT